MRKLLFLFIALVATSSVVAGDLYHVQVTTPEQAELLDNLSVEALARVEGGYLVLAKPQSATRLVASGLHSELLVRDVDKHELYFDNRMDRMDRQNADRFATVFEQGELRLYRITTAIDADQQHLISVANRTVPISFQAAVEGDLKSALRGLDVPLDSLVGLVLQDSLYNHVWTLQAFGPRVQGSSANFAARDWIYDKFVDYGYDSVYLDPFSSGYNNVVAVKLGTRFPDYQVVIGGHFDAVSGSPGADDNGSGTAGVIEMARILADIETDMTVIFIAFDAEETGLNGSEHYADAAVAAGDNIHFMFNMDMIANEGNANDVKTYHGDNMEYPDLFNHLADSLVGLTGHLSGNISASDHWPFHQNGYTIVMAHEYIFSSVYHSYQDSTSHMDFPYMTKVVKAGLATCYSVSQTAGPRPSLQFSYPGGLPTTVPPGSPTTVEVVVVGLYDGVPVSGTGMLHYDVDNHGWTHLSMSELTANHYQATLPGGSCYSLIRYYFTADEQTEGEIADPLQGDPYEALVATDEAYVLDDDFESDLGWTISGGSWARGTPTGGGGSYGNPDPTSGHSGANVMGYNLNGDYESSMVERHVTSPALDCSDLVGVKLSFWRWLGVEHPSYDHAYVRVSNNGSSWVTIWENGDTIEDSDWNFWSFDISTYADSQATVYIRFTMGETDGSWQFCGWNIDDVQVVGFACNDGTPIISTDNLPSWTQGYPYSQQLAATGGQGDLAWTDKNGDLSGSGMTLSGAGLLSGTPSAAGMVSFTAVVTDTTGAFDEQPLSITINPPVVVTPTTLPDWTAGVVFDQSLSASGGTGTITFSDQSGDLVGTGLVLAAGGQVSGTPAAAGPISFTALATDNVGAFDGHLFEFTVNPEVTISTETVPDANVGQPYSFFLGSAGGTGAHVWADKYGDLDDTGIALLPTGELNGAALNPGPITFTAEVADAVGGVAEKLFTIQVLAGYVCGDADGDGEGPNIADLVYMVDWMFNSGPAPTEMVTVDVNGDSAAGDIEDLVYLVTFMFQSGPALMCP